MGVNKLGGELAEGWVVVEGSIFLGSSGSRVWVFTERKKCAWQKVCERYQQLSSRYVKLRCMLGLLIKTSSS